MFNKCKHDWEIITEKILESPIKRIGQRINLTACDVDTLMQGTYICILKCKLCGKLDKTIEKI